MEKLTDIEKDILKEIFSFGLAKSADSLSVISKESVFIHIPGIEVLDLSNVASFVREIEPSASMIHSTIQGDITGETLLIFTQEQANRLSGICIGDPDSFQGNYLALKRSMLLELGNILTGSLVTQIANILDVNIFGTPPEMVTGAKRAKLESHYEDFFISKPIVLTVLTEFVNSHSVIELPFVIIFDIQTVDTILAIIREKTKTTKDLFAKPKSQE